MRGKCALHTLSVWSPQRYLLVISKLRETACTTTHLQLFVNCIKLLKTSHMMEAFTFFCSNKWIITLYFRNEYVERPSNYSKQTVSEGNVVKLMTRISTDERPPWQQLTLRQVLKATRNYARFLSSFSNLYNFLSR